MAANFLRTLNWSEDEDLVEKIIMLYNKAGAKQPLALFHETRAQVEIDEYRFVIFQYPNTQPLA